MKILHLSHTDISQDSRILKEMETLQDRGSYHAVGLGISTRRVTSGHIRSVRNQTKRITTQIQPIRSILKACALFLVYMNLMIGAVRIRSQAIHCHDWFVLPIGFLHKIVWSSVLVYDAHELESDTNTQSKIRKRGAYWVEKTLWKSIDGFITVSPSILDWYDKMFGIRIPNAVILNAPVVEIDVSQPRLNSRIDVREKYGIITSKSVGVYLGGLETGRGLDIILDAMSQVQNVSHFLFIGYGSYEKSLQARAKELGCENVTFVGKILHEEVVDYISGCDYGVCLIEPVSLSDIFALPNKLFEYACAGLYIYGSNLPEIRSFLEKTHLGEVLELNGAALAQAILTGGFKERSPADLDSLEKFGWHQQEEHLLALYEDVVKSDSASPPIN